MNQQLSRSAKVFRGGVFCNGVTLSYLVLWLFVDASFHGHHTAILPELIGIGLADAAGPADFYIVRIVCTLLAAAVGILSIVAVSSSMYKSRTTKQLFTVIMFLCLWLGFIGSYNQ
ncbi:MAG: hypothetical protein R3E01_12175 [Pirellulaceae bacterium]